MGGWLQINKKHHQIQIQRTRQIRHKNEDLEFTRTKRTRGQKNKEKRAKKCKCCSEDETEEDQQGPKRTVRFDVSHQARITEPEEMGAEIPNLPQVNQPSTAANGLLQPNPNPKTNSIDAIQATNPTISATGTREEEDTTNLRDFDPSDNSGEIERAEEVSADFSINHSNSGIGGAHVTRIIGHNWFKGRLKFKVEWDSEQTPWEDLRDLKEDHPRMAASCILEENLSRSKRLD
jgi:hypothetical protein